MSFRIFSNLLSTYKVLGTYYASIQWPSDWCSKHDWILTSTAFVPLSIRSSFVNTPKVLSPKYTKYYKKFNILALGTKSSHIIMLQKKGVYLHKANSRIPVGSTSLASFMASEVAMSWFAGVIANMMQLGYKIWKIQMQIK